MKDLLNRSESSNPYSLELRGVTKFYGQSLVVNQLSLQVKPGEFLTLLGSSGCGKTTTLRLIAGLETVSHGQIWMNGREITAVPPYERQISLVFQDYALFPHLTVEDNIAFGLKMRGMPLAQRRRRSREMLAFVQLSQVAKRRPSQLSGGQRQRVALARALVLEPALLLLDEPLGALDAELRRQMQNELKRIQTQLGMTFIYVTHDQEEALTMSDRIAVMRQGTIEQIGAPYEIYEHPQTLFVAQFIGQCNLRQGTVIQTRNQQITISDPALGRLEAQMANVPQRTKLNSGAGDVQALNYEDSDVDGEDVYTPDTVLSTMGENPSPYFSGQVVSVVIRPEKIQVSLVPEVSPPTAFGPEALSEKKSADQESEPIGVEKNQRSGIIQAVVYAGSVTRLTVAVANTELLVETHGRSAWQVGDRVWLAWSVKDAIVLPESLIPSPAYEDILAAPGTTLGRIIL